MKLLLADSGLSVNVGLKNLADKSLIHVSPWGHVEMHRLLQEMGRSIVRLEEPEKREFLDDSQDSFDVLSQGIGTGKVLSISLDVSKIDEFHVSENAFRGMRNLRFLKVYSSSRLDTIKLQLPESFDYLPPKLKLLRWDEYPMRCMPSKFRPENLVELKMENSKLEKLWEGIVSLPFLREMNLSRSKNLIEMPDLSKATNLETLDLGYCYSLEKLPSSIPHPNKLMKLDLTSCQNLETIPIGISLKSLKKLYLDGCSRLWNFPQISTNIETIDIDETRIEEILSNLHPEDGRLRELTMQNPKSTKPWERVQPWLTLLKAIMSTSLTDLRLSDIPTLVELPCSFQNLHRLRELEIKNCVNLETLPTGINLPSLGWLDLSGCSRLRTFPDISTTIERLYLNETAIEEVPCWIEKFTRLISFSMNGCNKLKFVSLNISKLKCLERVDLSDCLNLDQEALLQLKTYSDCLLRLSGEEVPSYFTHRTTVTSSSSFSLTAPLLPSALSQPPFLRFRACFVHTWYNMLEFDYKPSFTGRFWNSSDSYVHQEQDFCKTCSRRSERESGSLMIILDYNIPRDILAQMNYTHVDVQLVIKNHSPSEFEEWGIRLLEDSSSACTELVIQTLFPMFSKADDGSMLNEAGEGEECGGNDVVPEPKSKRMRIS